MWTLWCATDAGREGELIFRLVYQQAGCSKPILRLWMPDQRQVVFGTWPFHCGRSQAQPRLLWKMGLGDGNKPLSFQNQIRQAIDAALEQSPSTFDDFLKSLEASGIEVTRRGKSINFRFRVPGQKKPTRCNTLKGDYTEQAIRERIAGTYISSVQPKRSNSSVRMLIDIDAAMRAGKGAGYERWAKVFNVKQLAKAVAYLKEHGDMSYEDLQAKAQATTSRFNELSTQIKDMESRLSQNGELQKHIVNYSKKRAVYIEKPVTAKNSVPDMRRRHTDPPGSKEILSQPGVEKLPTIKTLREEYAEVLEAKRKAYAEYKQARAEMRELQNVKANIDYLLEPSAERTQEKEHS